VYARPHFKEKKMSNFIAGKVLRELELGLKVERATANITTGSSLFTISGGRIRLNLLVGEVTTVMETKTINFKLSANPTVGTTVDLCANLDLSADEAGTMYTIAGNNPATAMQRGESGVVIDQAGKPIIAAGTIEATVGATHTGSIKWTLFYVPIDDGASVEAA
jgi:hypothetical protein